MPNVQNCCAAGVRVCSCERQRKKARFFFFNANLVQNECDAFDCEFALPQSVDPSGWMQSERERNGWLCESVCVCLRARARLRASVCEHATSVYLARSYERSYDFMLFVAIGCITFQYDSSWPIHFITLCFGSLSVLLLCSYVAQIATSHRHLPQLGANRGPTDRISTLVVQLFAQISVMKIE